MRLRSLAPVALPALALSGWLQARGVGAIVGSRLAVPEIHLVREAQAAPEPPRARSADPILARNPFDSETGPLLPGAATGDAPASAAPDDGTMHPCDGVRVASVVTSADPDWSFAMLELRGEPEPVLRRRGGEVLAVGSAGVVLDRAGGRCVARIFAPHDGAAAASADAGSPAAPSGAARGIVRVGPSEYAIDRGARDALVEGAADLMRAVAVLPEKNGDRVVGLRIATLKPGTALDALGVRAGDVLVAADGLPLDSPDHMLQACGRLRTADHIRLELLRGGKPAQVDYDVR